MNNRSTVHRRLLACATLAIVLAGCGGAPERPVETTIYFDIGDAWTTTKRRVRLYDCRTGAMVCTGPASYLDVAYQCRCE